MSRRIPFYRLSRWCDKSGHKNKSLRDASYPALTCSPITAVGSLTSSQADHMNLLDMDIGRVELSYLEHTSHVPKSNRSSAPD
jgi:hypothetical protein